MDSAGSSASLDSSSLESRAGAECAPAGCSVRERVSRLERVLLGRASSDDDVDARDARHDDDAFPCLWPRLADEETHARNLAAAMEAAMAAAMEAEMVATSASRICDSSADRAGTDAILDAARAHRSHRGRSSASAFGSDEEQRELREICTSALIEFYERKERHARAGRTAHRRARGHEDGATLQEQGHGSDEESLPPPSPPTVEESPSMEFTYVRRALSALRLLEAARGRWPQDDPLPTAHSAEDDVATDRKHVDTASSAVFFHECESEVCSEGGASQVECGSSPAVAEGGEASRAQSTSRRRRRRRRRKRAGAVSESRSRAPSTETGTGTEAAATSDDQCMSPGVESSAECDRARGPEASHSKSATDAPSEESKPPHVNRSRSRSTKASRSESPSASERAGDGCKPAFPVHLSRRESWTGAPPSPASSPAHEASADRAQPDAPSQ